jgi:transposase-like protein
VVDNNMDALAWLRKQLDGDENDLVREMVREFAQRLMAAEVDSLTGAGWGEVSPERVNHRNGYRPRPFDTRVGTIDLAVPKLRRGSYFPDWLLDPRRRAEKALVAVVAECYVRGVSTRRVDGLVKTLGIESLSKSQVSRMAAELDQVIAEFRNRPLDQGPYTYVWMDALTQKVREGGRIINVAVVIAVGVNADGHREVLGLDVITTEDGAGWLAFLRGLVARGLAGVSLVISDAHTGLVDAIGSTLIGATWQRSSVHHPRRRLRVVEASRAGGMVPLVAPRRRERALAA